MGYITLFCFSALVTIAVVSIQLIWGPHTPSTSECMEYQTLYATGDWAIDAGSHRNWDPSEPRGRLNRVPGSCYYEVSLTHLVPHKTYQWKVTKEGTWAVNWGCSGRDGPNCKFTTDSTGAIVLHFVSTSDHLLYSSRYRKTEYPYDSQCGYSDQEFHATGDWAVDAGSYRNWSPSESLGVMKATNNKPCEYSSKIHGLVPYKKYQWKVTVGGTWAVNWGCEGRNGPNCNFTADSTGRATLSIVASHRYALTASTSDTHPCMLGGQLVHATGDWARDAGAFSNWSPFESLGLMTATAEDPCRYQKILTGLVPNKAYQWKVTVGGSWKTNFGCTGKDGVNCNFTADSTGAIRLSFDAAGNHTLRSYMVKVVEYPNNPECLHSDKEFHATGDWAVDAGSYRNWSPSESLGVMKATNNKPCEYSSKIHGLVPYKKYQWKVTVGRTWGINWGCEGRNGPNCNFTADSTGAIELKIEAIGNGTLSTVQPTPDPASLGCSFGGQQVRVTGSWAKDAGAFSNWNPSESRGLMNATTQDSCQYQAVVTGLMPNKAYQWKVTVGGTWSANWGCEGRNGPNCNVTADDLGAIDFRFAADRFALSALPISLTNTSQCKFEGQTLRATGDWAMDAGSVRNWNPAEALGLLHSTGRHPCEYETTVHGLSANRSYQWKVTVDGAWTVNWGCNGRDGPNCDFTANATGSATLRFVASTGYPLTSF